jgi:phosphoribosylpyrophosphate synthetase
LVIVEDRNDINRPPGVANCLHHYRWKPNLGQGGKLTLPVYYAHLFDRLLNDMDAVKGLRWRPDATDDTCTLNIEALDFSEKSKVEIFLETFQKVIVVGPNEFIRRKFDDELTFALALDFNFLDANHRTAIGQLEFRAKWQQSLDGLRVLTNHLVSAARWLPFGPLDQPVGVMGIPQHKRTAYRLPKALAAAIVTEGNQRPDHDDKFELLTPRLTCRKPGLKELPLTQKLACWDDLMQSGKVVLSDNVKNRTVLVVDDLYQSGVTMWSMARFLKQQGAAAVFGLTCVKSIRDTDNL